MTDAGSEVAKAVGGDVAGTPESSEALEVGVRPSGEESTAALAVCRFRAGWFGADGALGHGGTFRR